MRSTLFAALALLIASATSASAATSSFQAEALGIELTESYAMTPAAAVSGLYFAHPESRYFSIGRIGRDQVANYAKRKGWSIAEAERWLAPNLGYEPD